MYIFGMKNGEHPGTPEGALRQIADDSAERAVMIHETLDDLFERFVVKVKEDPKFKEEVNKADGIQGVHDAMTRSFMVIVMVKLAQRGEHVENPNAQLQIQMIIEKYIYARLYPEYAKKHGKEVTEEDLEKFKKWRRAPTSDELYKELLELLEKREKGELDVHIIDGEELEKAQEKAVRLMEEGKLSCDPPDCFSTCPVSEMFRKLNALCDEDVEPMKQQKAERKAQEKIDEAKRRRRGI